VTTQQKATGNLAKPKPSTDPERFVDAIEAGRFLHLRPRRVLELARRGALPAYPIGDGVRRVWRFLLSELASAVRSRALHSARQSPAPLQEKA
jgi:hypothetical protein